jgi:hypothetical protein
MKKKTASNPLKFFNDEKAKAYMKAGGVMKAFKKSLPTAELGQQTEYDRNIKRSIDADKELKDIVNQSLRNPQILSNPRTIQNMYDKYPENSRGMVFEGASDNWGVRSPYATDSDMKTYDQEISSFYKKNPNVKPYVGGLKTKPATPIQKKGGVVKKKKK